MRLLIGFLLIALLVLQGMLWFGEGGYRNVQRLEARLEEQAATNEELVQRNLELKAEVEDLRERLDAVEERARNELGLIREDEEFYQVVPAPDSRNRPRPEPEDDA